MSPSPPSATTSVLCFDFGGTLDADGLTWEARFHTAFRRQGGRLGPDEFAPFFRDSDRALAGLTGIRRLGFRAMVETQARLLAELLPAGSVLRPLLLADDFVAETLAFVDRNRPLLAGLARRYRLAVISNFTGNLEPCLEELGLLEIFSLAIDSTVAGVAKPDARIFRLALDGLGAEPARTWMIGDNPNADIRGAVALGLRTAWLAPFGRAWAPAEGERPGESPVPTRVIRRLVDLPQALAECTA